MLPDVRGGVCGHSGVFIGVPRGGRTIILPFTAVP